MKKGRLYYPQRFRSARGCQAKGSGVRATSDAAIGKEAHFSTVRHFLFIGERKKTAPEHGVCVHNLNIATASVS